jgi:hypothetical protein
LVSEADSSWFCRHAELLPETRVDGSPRCRLRPGHSRLPRVRMLRVPPRTQRRRRGESVGPRPMDRTGRLRVSQTYPESRTESEADAAPPRRSAKQRWGVCGSTRKLGGGIAEAAGEGVSVWQVLAAVENECHTRNFRRARGDEGGEDAVIPTSWGGTGRKGSRESRVRQSGRPREDTEGRADST